MKFQTYSISCIIIFKENTGRLPTRFFLNNLFFRLNLRHHDILFSSIISLSFVPFFFLFFHMSPIILFLLRRIVLLFIFFLISMLMFFPGSISIIRLTSPSFRFMHFILIYNRWYNNDCMTNHSFRSLCLTNVISLAFFFLLLITTLYLFKGLFSSSF